MGTRVGIWVHAYNNDRDESNYRIEIIIIVIVILKITSLIFDTQPVKISHCHLYLFFAVRTFISLFLPNHHFSHPLIRFVVGHNPVHLTKILYVSID